MAADPGAAELRPEPTIEPADDEAPDVNDDGLIVCAAGTRPSKTSSYAQYLWIQPTAGSPRMELYLGHEAWMLPNYTAQRIVDAANKGQKTVAFSPAELEAYRRAMAVPPPPPPSMYGGPAYLLEGGEYRGRGDGGRLQRRNRRG